MACFRSVASLMAVCLVVASSPAWSLSTSSPVISTTTGPVQGASDQYSFYFKGIPFAAPPVGPLRFKDPQPPTPWTTPINATTFSAGCMQRCVLPKPLINCPATMSEDCLYLNVFTPSLIPRSLPVLIFIHGGAFEAGAAGTPLYESSALARSEGMVVVAGNYRLGAFGAFFGGDSTGNFQLKDQRMVFQWVQDNIAQFGGDPTRVVISGQSAGAMSVGCHLASPKSWPYFNSTIMSSNPFALLMLTPAQATSLGSSFAKNAGCPETNNLACLQAADATVLLNASKSTKPFPWPGQVLTVPVPWVPVVTGDDLPVQPLFAQGSQVNPTANVLIGVNTNDSLLFIYEATGAAKFTKFEADLLLTYVFGVDNAVKIKLQYGKVPEDEPVQMYLSYLLNDYLFLCPRRFYARNLAARGTLVYQYLFDHVPSMSNWIWNDSATPECDNYVCHADDLPFVFNSTQFIAGAPAFTSDEQKLVNFMQGVYGESVRTHGSQVPPNLNWNPAFSNQAGNMDNAWHFTGTGGEPITDHHKAQCDFWDKIGYNRN